jgi:SAM-dependent methyltransferase
VFKLDHRERTALRVTSALEMSECLARYKYALSQLNDTHKLVLDCPSGEGYGTNLLHDAGKQVHGCDYDPATCEVAKTAYPECVFDVGDMRNLPYPDQKFDAVVCLEGIEHVNEDAQVLKGFFRILRPQGRLIVSTPNRNLWPLAGQNPFHIREYTPPELKELFIACGFVNVTWFGFGVSPAGKRIHSMYRNPVSRLVYRAKKLLLPEGWHSPRALAKIFERAVSGTTFEDATAVYQCEHEVEHELMIFVGDRP